LISGSKDVDFEMGRKREDDHFNRYTFPGHCYGLFHQMPVVYPALISRKSICLKFVKITVVLGHF